MKKLISLY